MKTVETQEQVDALIADGQPIVFLFVTSWCPDCQVMKPFLPELEREFSDFLFVQLDRDDFLPLAKEWNVFGIPSLVVYRAGREIGRFVDKNRKTKQEIQTFLKELNQ